MSRRYSSPGRRACLLGTQWLEAARSALYVEDGCWAEAPYILYAAVGGSCPRIRRWARALGRAFACWLVDKDFVETNMRTVVVSDEQNFTEEVV